jgi:hypothetical protein
VKRRKSQKAKSSFDNKQAESLRALESYHGVLYCLTKSGISLQKNSFSRLPLPYVQEVEGLENLYRSLSAVAPARPAAVDEEWNPLSQRPHSPLPPLVGNELGAEITALKEAIDAFTTLSHEMMHVALWEPFFTGKWRPRNRAQFRNFSLMAEGYCFFFGDIIVTSLIRTRFADGEFAFARQTPSNALFHPVRAFAALGISNKNEILDIYLDGFVGKQTSLATSRHASNFASFLAGRIYEFYSGTLGYLNHMHEVFLQLGVLDEFYQRFCNLPELPTFLEDSDAKLLRGPSFKPFFKTFFRRGQKILGQLSEEKITSIRWRRMLQSRAYYALQVRWYLSEERLIAKRWSAAYSQRVLKHVDSYLSSIETLLAELAQSPSKSPVAQLAAIDLNYEHNVRRLFIDHEIWVGHRWLIVPKRAGGLISVCENTNVDAKSTKIKVLRTVAFVLDELTREMKAAQTIEKRTELLAEIERVAAIGAACSTESSKVLKGLEKRLITALVRPLVRQTWSLPLAAFNPGQNLFRELAFSYQ